MAGTAEAFAENKQRLTGSQVGRASRRRGLEKCLGDNRQSWGAGEGVWEVLWLMRQTRARSWRGPGCARTWTFSCRKWLPFMLKDSWQWWARWITCTAILQRSEPFRSLGQLTSSEKMHLFLVLGLGSHSQVTCWATVPQSECSWAPTLLAQLPVPWEMALPLLSLAHST